MIITSFNDWQWERWEENPEVECPTCEGTGIVTGFGGTFDSDLCDSCMGECVLPVQELGQWAVLYAFTEREYTEQLTKELSQLADWVGRKPEEVIVDAGLVPYTRLVQEKEICPSERISVFKGWAKGGLDINLRESRA